MLTVRRWLRRGRHVVLLFSSLFLAAPLGCGEAIPPPTLSCPRGLSPVWIDRAADLAECQVDLPLRASDSPRTGLQQPFPEMLRPPESRNSPERIELGRLLFFDPILSGDNTLSCAHCHHPDRGFTDNRPHSIGIRGQAGERSAPTVWNAAFSRAQFWDGRATTLEDQAKGPIQNPIEMAEDPANLIRELSQIPEYAQRFAQAFAGPDAISLDNIARAIATFERTLVSLHSPFDRYAAGEDHALSESARRGLNLYRSVSTRCFECHGLPLFANPDYKVIGVPAATDPTREDSDRGRAVVAPGRAYEHAFKVPTLRNVARTAPYMHNGVFSTLDQVLDFYSRGGGPGHGFPIDNVDDKIRKFPLSAQEKADLIAFLDALTDESLTPDVPTQVPSGLPVIQRLAQ